MKFDWRRILPKYWYQQGPTDWEWDAILNDILDNAKEVVPGDYTTEIDGITLWTSNWPFSYGWFYPGRTKMLPSIKTRHRLRDVVEDARKKQFRELIKGLRK